MENILIWGITVFIALVIILPYWLKSLKRHKSDQQKHAEAERLGATKAVAQHPQINDMYCIGCGACVDACPEGDVLGIVSGRAAIINGLKCVGHGKCEEACPVGAIKVGLGDLSTREDIPALNESYETNLPGVYIAGELGGLALIRNAITQGAKVADAIKQKNNGGSAQTYDVAIVGAGPAGLSTALRSLEHKMNIVIIDQQDAGGTILQYPRKKLVMTQPVEIPLYGKLSRPEYSKEELLEIWQKMRDQYRLNIQTGEKLIDLKKEDKAYLIKTDKNQYSAQSVVLALGRRGTPRKLGVSGEDRAKVMYKLMDAESYQKHNILIVGGGDSAIEAAIGLARQKGNRVTISYRKEKFFRIKTRNEQRVGEMIDTGKINALFSSNVISIEKDKVILETTDGQQTIPNDYVFIFAGGEPPFKLLKQFGIRFGGAYNS